MGQSLFFPQQAATAPTPVPDQESTRPESNPRPSHAEPSPPDEQPPVPEPRDPPETQGPTPPQRPVTALTPSPSEPQDPKSSLPILRPSSLDKIKKPGGVWDIRAPLGFHSKKDGRSPGAGAAVSEQLDAPAPSRASPAPPDRPLTPPQAECSLTVPRVSPPPVEETAPQSGDSDNSKSPVLTFNPPEKTQAHEPSRFQFGRKQEFNPFQHSPQSETIARKAISLEECSLTTSTVSDELKALQTTVATKSASQTAISPVRAKATAPLTGSGTSLEKQSPSKSSTKQVPAQAMKQGAAQAAPLSSPNSFQLVLSPAAEAQGPLLTASETQTFSVSVVHKAVGSGARARRVNRLRKRQNDMVASRRGKISPRAAGSSEAKQQTRATESAKLESSPALSVTGLSPVFSVLPSRPALTPPAFFNFSQGPRKPEAKPPSETVKGFGALADGKPTKGQFNSTQPGQPKFAFSSLSTPISPKPVKMGPTPSNPALSPIQEVNPGGFGWPTSAPDTNTSPYGPALPSVIKSPSNTSLKAKKKFHFKTSTVEAAQHPGSGQTKKKEEKKEQAIPTSATPPPQPSPQTPVQASPCSSDATPAKPKKKIRIKFPLDVVKFKNPGTGNKVEKKEKKEKRKEGMADLPASPPSPECPHRPSGSWPPFTAEQPCSRKARCRHQDSTELPRNVTQWLSAKQNYLCEPPWVTTATLTASVALMLRQDGTDTQP